MAVAGRAHNQVAKTYRTSGQVDSVAVDSCAVREHLLCAD
jgi:hypothetical protein